MSQLATAKTRDNFGRRKTQLKIFHMITSLPFFLKTLTYWRKLNCKIDKRIFIFLVINHFLLGYLKNQNRKLHCSRLVYKSFSIVYLQSMNFPKSIYYTIKILKSGEIWKDVSHRLHSLYSDKWLSCHSCATKPRPPTFLILRGTKNIRKINFKSLRHSFVRGLNAPGFLIYILAIV